MRKLSGKRRIARIVTAPLICILAAIVLTWPHWYWRDPFGRVTIDGKPQPRARVYRGWGGWNVIEAPVAGFSQTYVYSSYERRAGEVIAKPLVPIRHYWAEADAWTTPFAVIARNAPIGMDDIAASELTYDPKPVETSKGVSFTIVEISPIVPKYWFHRLQVTW